METYRLVAMAPVVWTPSSSQPCVAETSEEPVYWPWTSFKISNDEDGEDDDDDDDNGNHENNNKNNLKIIINTFKNKK